MSRVFLAREVALDRDVVVKVVAPELREGISADRFTREVQLAARLQQANIVPVLSAGNANGMPYYTMPFVDGQSLRARLLRGPVPIGEALDILRDVARALAYAHGAGIVHRDIKPENILLSSGTAVVTDFGIAKALSVSRTRDGAKGATLTLEGTSLGTPAYMAPEQALGDDVDARSDLYALGVVAWELLAGAHPFATHTTAQRLVAAHLSETPPPLRSVRPEVPQDVSALVMQCLAKDAASRPASANELLERLSAASTPRPAPSVEAGGMRHAGRWVAAAVTLVVAVALITMLMSRRAPAAPPVRTVVVVPFENLGDPADAYFAAGVSDEIAGQLARLPGLQVIGREGVQRFRDSHRAPREIARELGAAWVLSGTVRWARVPTRSASVDGEARVRIVPALVDVASGIQSWSEPFEERLTDVFTVQAGVAERVAAALSITLGGAARAALRKQESTDPQARDAQLLGRYLLRQRGRENLRRAISAFEQAIGRDSAYARAWAGLSEATALLPSYLDRTEPDEVVLARAERAARRAVALDSTLPEVQVALARAHSSQFRFREALHSVDRAIELDPNATLAYTLKLEILTGLGRLAEAGAASRRALELDAFSAVALNNRAIWFLSAGQADSAIHAAERAVEVDPVEPLWKRTRGTVYAYTGHYAEGVRSSVAGGVPLAICDPTLGALAGLPEKRAPALAVLGPLSRIPGSAGSPVWAAMIYARLGVTDSVFSRLAAGVASYDDSFAHLITLPVFTPYQSDPRWDAIVGQVRRR